MSVEHEGGTPAVGEFPAPTIYDFVGAALMPSSRNTAAAVFSLKTVSPARLGELLPSVDGTFKRNTMAG